MLCLQVCLFMLFMHKSSFMQQSEGRELICELLGG